MMIFPKKIPGLKWLAILTAVYGLIWMSLEGNLVQVVLLGTAVSVTLTGHFVQRYIGGRYFRLPGWLAAAQAGGLLAGLGSGILTFCFMALKTGLHGHGPEYSAAEIEWVLGMIPLWGLAGLAAGLGLGLLAWELRRKS
jgi:hypothetical protein